MARDRFFLLLAAAVIAVGCAKPEGEEDQGVSEANVEVAPSVVIADGPTENAVEVKDDSVRIPVAMAHRYLAMPPGTVFVGGRALIPRGAAASAKNPDGFLRRVVSTRTEGDSAVIMTTPATLTDAIVNGQMKASSHGGAGSFDELSTRAETFKIDLDLAGQTLFDNVDEVPSATGTTRFHEFIKIEQGKLFARPNVDFDLAIRGGKVTRFLAKVEGQLKMNLGALTEVVAEGAVSPSTNKALYAIPHEVTKVVYKSDRMPLPTIMVGKVPVSPAVQFTVTMKCKLAFGGPLAARAGIDADSYIRVAALQQNGAWGPPSKSQFDIKPSFTVDRASPTEARCTLESDAEISAYGTAGLMMSVAPYVDFMVSGSSELPTTTTKTEETSGLPVKTLKDNVLIWSTVAGATGWLRGKPDVFGITALDQPLAEWKAAPIIGQVTQ